MNKKKLLTILLTLAIAASSAALMSGCAASVAIHGGAVGGAGASDSAGDSTGDGLDTTTTTTDEGDGESSEAEETDESSEAEEESSEAEESYEAEESSEEEESSETEESKEEEESKSDETGDKNVIKMKKGEKWGDDINVYIYNEVDGVKTENAPWPGEPMTKEDDGTYSYSISEDIENPLIIFNDGKKQYPSGKGLEYEEGKVYDIDELKNS